MLLSPLDMIIENLVQQDEDQRLYLSHTTTADVELRYNLIKFLHVFFQLNQ